MPNEITKKRIYTSDDRLVLDFYEFKNKEHEPKEMYIIGMNFSDAKGDTLFKFYRKENDNSLHPDNFLLFNLLLVNFVIYSILLF